MNGIVQFRKCTLDDQELISRVDKATDAMYQTGRLPDRQIPARPNDDYDLLIGELLVRFSERVAILKESTPSTEQEGQEDLINELIHETFGASLAGREKIAEKFIITRRKQ